MSTLVGRILCWLGCLPVALLLVFDIVYADEVLLSNGDRLTGKISKMEDGILRLQTSYGGEIKITWSEVRSLKSETPFRL